MSFWTNAMGSQETIRMFPVAKALQRPARGWSTALSACLALAVAGCTDAQNNKKTIFGALGGGIAASGACLLARGNALTCATVGLSGAIIGGVIGHSFDDRDRARRDAAVRQALLDRRLWQPPYAPSLGAVAAPTDQTEAELEQPAAPLSHAAPQPSAQGVAASHAVAAVPPVTWQNPDTSNSGKIVPLRTFASPTTGQACKVYREDYIRDGKQYSDTMQACPKTNGSGFDFKVLS